MDTTQISNSRGKVKLINLYLLDRIWLAIKNDIYEEHAVTWESTYNILSIKHTKLKITPTYLQLCKIHTHIPKMIIICQGSRFKRIMIS